MKVSTSQERIRQLMDMYNLTLSDLAKRTGLAKSTLSYYINGKSIPRQEQIAQIADAFSINPAWLMGYDVKLPYKMEQMDFTLTPEEMELLVEYRRTDDNTKESIKRLLAYWKMMQERGLFDEYREAWKNLSGPGDKERQDVHGQSGPQANEGRSEGAAGRTPKG